MISQDSPVPAKVSWGVLAFIVCSIFALGGYVMSQDTSTKDNSDRIAKVEARQEKFNETVASIDNKIAILQTLMEYIIKHKGN